MPLTAAERRFLRNWEEQRHGGKSMYVLVYTLGWALVIFMTSVALALFMNLPFIKLQWIVIMLVGAIVGGLLLALGLWKRCQRRFRRIIEREIAANN